MTLNQKLWGKVILSSYNYLNRLSDSLDKLIEKTALNSYYSYSYRFNNNTIEDVFNKISSYSNRKIDYINLKVLTEKALKSIPKHQAKLLILKFIQNMTIEKASQILQISTRSSYRRLEQAIASFMSALTHMGFTVEKLELDYANDPFIRSAYKLVKKNNFLIAEKAEVATTDSIFNTYINEMIASVI